MRLEFHFKLTTIIFAYEEIIYKLYRMYDQIIEFMENPTEFEGFSEVE